MKVTILFNLPGSGMFSKDATEADEDTYETVKEVFSGLTDEGYEVDTCGVDEKNISKILKINSDIIFNLIEWTGKDMNLVIKVFRLLNKTGIPYTGSDVNGYLISLDKVKMKKLFDKLKIPTPKWLVFSDLGDLNKRNLSLLKYPIILKPAYEHCGIGIDQNSIVENENTLKKKVEEMLSKFEQPILAEEFIEGREINVTILENNLRPWVLPPVEILFGSDKSKRAIYSYERKWNSSSKDFWQTSAKIADLSKKTLTKISNLAKKAYLGLGGRDYPRLDIRLDGENPVVLEINNNPSVDFTFQGGLGKSAIAAGFSYGRLLNHVVSQAYWRFMNLNQYASV